MNSYVLGNAIEFRTFQPGAFLEILGVSCVNPKPAEGGLSPRALPRQHSPDHPLDKEMRDLGPRGGTFRSSLIANTPLDQVPI